MHDRLAIRVFACGLIPGHRQVAKGARVACQVEMVREQRCLFRQAVGVRTLQNFTNSEVQRAAVVL